MDKEDVIRGTASRAVRTLREQVERRTRSPTINRGRDMLPVVAGAPSAAMFEGQPARATVAAPRVTTVWNASQATSSALARVQSTRRS